MQHPNQFKKASQLMTCASHTNPLAMGLQVGSITTEVIMTKGYSVETKTCHHRYI
jgi:hypothetical protein